MNMKQIKERETTRPISPQVSRKEKEQNQQQKEEDQIARIDSFRKLIEKVGLC